MPILEFFGRLQELFPRIRTIMTLARKIPLLSFASMRNLKKLFTINFGAINFGDDIFGGLNQFTKYPSKSGN